MVKQKIPNCVPLFQGSSLFEAHLENINTLGACCMLLMQAKQVEESYVTQAITQPTFS